MSRPLLRPLLTVTVSYASFSVTWVVSGMKGFAALLSAGICLQCVLFSWVCGLGAGAEGGGEMTSGADFLGRAELSRDSRSGWI